jgi:hypothetical protein
MYSAIRSYYYPDDENHPAIPIPPIWYRLKAALPPRAAFLFNRLFRTTIHRFGSFWFDVSDIEQPWVHV